MSSGTTDLVELEVIQELVQLPVLLLLLELEVVLLKTVEGQLSLVIDVDLEWLGVSSCLSIRERETTYRLHELFTSGSDLLGKGSGEHHDLLVVGSSSEDFLNVSSHV